MIIIDKIKIIGRTKVNLDLYEEREVKIDYFKIEKLVNQFINDNYISVLPIDVVEITKKQNWLIVPYSRIKKELYDMCEEIIYTDWGFAIYYNGQYMIFYNDSIKLGSQRFTIAHEIGHIVLEHFMYSDATTREMEANAFASRLLMPLDIIDKCKVYSQLELSELCGVSLSAASYCFKKLKKMRTSNTKVRKDKNECIQSQFNNFINVYLNKKRKFKDDK